MTQNIALYSIAGRVNSKQKDHTLEALHSEIEYDTQYSPYNIAH